MDPVVQRAELELRVSNFAFGTHDNIVQLSKNKGIMLHLNKPVE